jgi:sarcosine oxidase subunit gamma
VVGAEVRQMLSKICAINLNLDEFPNLKIAQTIIADLSVIIIRHDLGLTPCFYLLADIALTEYLWEVLQDAMDEFAGATVGLAALLTLKTQLAESSK